jgi:uncharacterized protein YaaW (UPF0174 family)
MSELKSKVKTYCQYKCQFYYSPSFVCNVSDKCPLVKERELLKQKLQQLIDQASRTVDFEGNLCVVIQYNQLEKLLKAETK